MQYRRARNPQALKHIENRVLDNGDFIDKSVMIKILEARLKDEEEAKQTFVLVIIDESQKNKIVGHVIAISNPLAPFVFIYEAEYNNQLTTAARQDLVMNSKQFLIDWARLQNKTKIRMQTNRNPEIWQRSWGLKPIATIMEFDLNENQDDFEDLQPLTENNHGRRITIGGVESSGRPEGIDSGNHTSDSRGADKIGEPEQPFDDGGTTIHRSSPRETAEGNGQSGIDGEHDLADNEPANVHERFISELERNASLQL